MARGNDYIVYTLPSICDQLVLCSVAAVKRLPVHQPMCSLYFILAFEISEHILRNQNLIIGVDSYSRQPFMYLDPVLIYIIHLIDCLCEIHKCASCFLLAFVAKSLQNYWWGFFRRNFEVWSIYFLTNVFTALKGTPFCIFIYNILFSRNVKYIIISSLGFSRRYFHSMHGYSSYWVVQRSQKTLYHTMSLNSCKSYTVTLEIVTYNTISMFQLHFATNYWISLRFI